MSGNDDVVLRGREGTAGGRRKDAVNGEEESCINLTGCCARRRGAVCCIGW